MKPRLLFLALLLLTIPTAAQPCTVSGAISPIEMISGAEAIVRAAAVEYARPPADSAQPFAVAGAACAIGRADERGLHRVYWELLNLTEICVETLAPPPVSLSFVLVYQGNRVAGDPVSILVRIQADVWVGPELPTFNLHVDDRRLEVMSPNRRYELVYPCPPHESCAFNGVVGALSAEELRLISKASVMSGHVFGKGFIVSAETLRPVGDLAALADSVR